MRAIAADPRHPGADIGFVAVRAACAADLDATINQRKEPEGMRSLPPRC
jgi:hypothetical protein